jgi:hypothetical protein
VSGIRELLEALEDPYPLRLQVREARDALARRRSVLALRQFNGERAADSDLDSDKEALRQVEEAAAALEGGWETLEQVVAEAEAERGIAPPEPAPEVLAEVHLLTSGASTLHDGYAPRTAPPPSEPKSIGGQTALAVGAGLALMALGVPHLAVHAAMSATHGDKGPKTIRKPLQARLAGRAMDRLHAGLPAGEPSADGVRQALDALARAPRDRACWDGFVEAAQERIAVLRRTHLRARAAAMLAEER